MMIPLYMCGSSRVRRGDMREYGGVLYVLSERVDGREIGRIEKHEKYVFS